MVTYQHYHWLPGIILQPFHMLGILCEVEFSVNDILFSLKLLKKVNNIYVVFCLQVMILELSYTKFTPSLILVRSYNRTKLIYFHFWFTLLHILVRHLCWHLTYCDKVILGVVQIHIYMFLNLIILQPSFAFLQ